MTTSDPVHRSNECSCGGSNECCFRCYGTGIIRDRGKPSIATPPGQQTTQDRAPTPAENPGEPPNSHLPFAEICAKCSFHGTPKQLRMHEAQVHTAKEARCPNCSFVGTVSQLKDHQQYCRGVCTIRPDRRKRKNPALYKCILCRLVGSLGSIRKHVRFEHKVEAVCARWSKCPVCPAQVKKGRLERHVRNAHRLEINVELVFGEPDYTARSRKRDGLHNPSRTGSQLIARDDPRNESRLDRTKPYAHAYRERGKFGSHPAHDGYDDESSP